MSSDDDLDPDQATMPAAEVDITVDLVHYLLTDQHPDLADLALEPLANGWDNVLFRLGEEYVVRLPRRRISAQLVEHEQQWLPQLARDLPLPIPVPIRVGRPSDTYPWTWSIQPWYPGTAVGNGGWSNPRRAAEDLGRFLAALHQPAPETRPVNQHRGGPLIDRDDMTVERIQRFSPGLGVATDEVLELWKRCATTEPWAGPPIWIHGDLHLFNIIQHDGRLAAVIDFGDICGGDPSCDLAIGWSAFDDPHRQVFRQAADTSHRPISDETWLRARGWCLSIGYTMIAFSADNPSHEQMGVRMVNAALGTL